MSHLICFSPPMEIRVFYSDIFGVQRRAVARPE